MNKKKYADLDTKPSLYLKLITILASRNFLYATVVWFLIQASYFAIATRFGLPPDEKDHFNFIQLFSQNGFSPFLTHQDGFFSLGEAVRTPFFLYHYLLSIPFKLISSWEYSYVVLRFINVGITLGSLYLVVGIANLSRLSRHVRNISIFLLTNTLMFVFLAGSISYDNLFVFFALASLFLYLKLRTDLSARNLFLLLCVMLSGSMVKVTYLPVALVIVLMIFYSLRKNLRKSPVLIYKSFNRDWKLNTILLALLIMLSSLFINRYIMNIVRYGTYEPKCQQVLQLDRCRESALFVRNEGIYGPNKRPASKNILEYFIGWTPLILKRTYGIFAHKELLPAPFTIIAILTFALLGVYGCITKGWRALRVYWPILIFSTSYVLVVFLENFSIYEASGRASFAVHGRYLFAALPLLYLLVVHFFCESPLSNRIKTMLLAGVLIVLIGSSLPTYLIKSDPTWRSPVRPIIIKQP